MAEAISQPKNRRPASEWERLLASRLVLKIVDRGRPETLNSLRECASTSWQSQVVIPSKCCEAALRRKAQPRENPPLDSDRSVDPSFKICQQSAIRGTLRARAARGPGAARAAVEPRRFRLGSVRSVLGPLGGDCVHKTFIDDCSNGQARAL